MDGVPFPAEGYRVMHGVQEPRAVQNPVAGADWSFTCDQGYYRRLKTGRGILTTSAVVANRLPRFQFQDADGNVLWETVVPSALVAGQTNRVSWAIGVTQQGTGANNSVSSLSLPAVWLPPGYKVAVSTLGLDTTANTGDQWSAVVLWFDAVDRGSLHDKYIEEQLLVRVQEGTHAAR